MNKINHTRLAAGGTIQGPKRLPPWKSRAFILIAATACWLVVCALLWALYKTVWPLILGVI